MVRSERELLSGNVEVDETLVGGVKHGGKRGRSTAKSIVVIAVEVLKPKGFGRVRMRYVPDASGDSLVPSCAILSFLRHQYSPTDGVATGWRTGQDS